ncbi:MAG TPA: hypothetical protein VEB64_11305 [Azospirillaceae bacterium]|nr:hypothetical protein [Azospirillaceae bacterium]
MTTVMGVGSTNSGGSYPSFSYSNPNVQSTGNLSGYSAPQLLKSNFAPDRGSLMPLNSNTGGNMVPPSLTGPASVGISTSPVPAAPVGYGYTSTGGATGMGASMIGTTVSISV